jgi:hypothetical protein
MCILSDMYIRISILLTFIFTCEVQTFDSNYSFVRHRKDNICNNKGYLLYFTHDIKRNNLQLSKILIFSDKRANKKSGSTSKNMWWSAKPCNSDKFWREIKNVN